MSVGMATKAGAGWPRLQPHLTKADQRSTQIYEAAARLFYEKGFAGTTLQDLADAIGLHKASLYHYISSKDELLFATVDYAHSSLTGILATADVPGLTPLQKIQRILRAHAEFCAEHVHITAVFYKDGGALAPEHLQRVIDARNNYEQAVRHLIVEGQEAGEIRADLDSKLAVLAVFGVVNWIIQWYEPSSRLTPEEVGVQFSQLALRILTDNPPTPVKESD